MNKTMKRFGMAGALILAGIVTAQAAETAAATGDHFEADSSHATVGFRVEHMVVSKVGGQFKDFTGNLDMAGDQVGSLSGTIKAASIDTSNAKRDEHLRNPDFFDVAKYPEITFKSTAVKDGAIVGDLTMHGVTKSIELASKVSGPVQDPYNNTRMGLELTGKIDRRDFGLTWSKNLDKGGLVVGNDVDLNISIEFTKK